MRISLLCLCLTLFGFFANSAQAADRPTNVSIEAIVEILSTDSGDVMVYVSATDASGNDIVISEAQFVALMVD